MSQITSDMNLESNTHVSSTSNTLDRNLKSGLQTTGFTNGILAGLQNQRAKPKNNTYKLKMALLRLFAFVAFIIFYKFVWAQTVSNYQYIESEITKLSEKNTDFDQIKNLFSKSPVYKTVCYSDPSIAPRESQAKTIFGPHIPETINGTMSFDLAAFDLGFSVLQKIELDVKGQNVESEVQCVASADGCISLNQSLESAYPEIEPSDDYFSEVTKSENWSTYILDSKTLYSELSLSLSTNEKGMFNRKQSPITYSKNYLCISRMSSEQTEL